MLKRYFTFIVIAFIAINAHAACFKSNEAKVFQCKRTFDIEKDNQCSQIYKTTERKNYGNCANPKGQSVRADIDRLTYELISMQSEGYSAAEITAKTREIDELNKSFAGLLKQATDIPSITLKTAKQSASQQAGAKPVKQMGYVFSKDYLLSNANRCSEAESDMDQNGANKILKGFLDVLRKEGCEVDGSVDYQVSKIRPNVLTVNVAGSCPETLLSAALFQETVDKCTFSAYLTYDSSTSKKAQKINVASF